MNFFPAWEIQTLFAEEAERSLKIERAAVVDVFRTGEPHEDARLLGLDGPPANSAYTANGDFLVNQDHGVVAIKGMGVGDHVALHAELPVVLVLLHNL